MSLVCVVIMNVISFAGRCLFPKSWSGMWFQSGVPQLLTINTTFIDTKGMCVENEGDKFIIEDR